MKRIKLLLLAAIFPVFLFSQSFEIIPNVGYMFGGSIQYVQGKLKVDDGMNYGLSVLVPVQPTVDVELNYTRLDTDAKFDVYYGYPSYNDTAVRDLGINYIQVGGISKFDVNSDVAQPFGSLSLGATWFASPDLTSTVWRFSATLGLGVKLMFSDRVGIMLRGRLMMPMNFAGTSLYFGTGGSGLSMNSYVAPLQGDFNGGLIIKVGN